MKPRRLLMALVIFPALALGQTASDLSTLEKRTASLDLARSLLTTKSFNDSAEEINRKNPFNPQRAVVQHIDDVPTPTAETPVTIADRDRLVGMAEGVTPTGTMQLGDTAYLLFGQKKFKEGDSMPISFQGATYEVQISAIERTNFTLRYNNEEIIRPIKSSNKP
jgi:hypothetical protein